MTEPPNAASSLDGLMSFFSQQMQDVPGFDGDPLKDPQGAMKAQLAFAENEMKKRASLYGRVLTTPEGIAMLQDMAEATVLRSPVPDITALASFDQLAPIMLWNAAQAQLVRGMIGMAKDYLNTPDEEANDD